MADKDTKYNKSELGRARNKRREGKDYRAGYRAGYLSGRRSTVGKKGKK